MYQLFIFIGVLFTCLLNQQPTLAQERDVVITQSGDTIFCQIKTDIFGFPTKYRRVDSTEFVRLKEKEIKYYYIASKKEAYRSVKLPNKTKNQLLRLVEDGKINLYVRYTQAGNTGSVATWFVSKGEGELHELKTSALFSFKSKQDRKEAFANMLADNQEVLQQYMSDDSFSFKNIRNIVHLYNTGQPYVDSRSFGEKLKDTLF